MQQVSQEIFPVGLREVWSVLDNQKIFSISGFRRPGEIAAFNNLINLHLRARDIHSGPRRQGFSPGPLAWQRSGRAIF